MLTSAEITCFAAGLALVPLIKLLLFSCSSLYNDDRDVLAMNASLPSTRWFNLGFWRPGVTSFPEAAQELCLETARRAELSQGGRVLEVGSGYGESAAVLLRTFPISSYLGVTSVPSHHAYATSRYKELDLNAHFKLGDALAETEALFPGSLDAVIAVDCAYHFPRDRWLRSASRALDDDGRIALTDLLLPRPLSVLEELTLRIICLMAGLPFRNLVSVDSYEAELRRQGWEDVRLEDISESVYPGFLRFIERQGTGLGHALTAWSGLEGYSKVVKWYRNLEKPRLAFYMISARKSRGRGS